MDWVPRNRFLSHVTRDDPFLVPSCQTAVWWPLAPRYVDERLTNDCRWAKISAVLAVEHQR